MGMGTNSRAKGIKSSRRERERAAEGWHLLAAEGTEGGKIERKCKNPILRNGIKIGDAFFVCFFFFWYARKTHGGNKVKIECT